MDEQFVPGKKRIIVSSSLLLAIGAAEIVMGSLVLDASSGYYAGAIYTGIICFIAGLHGASHGLNCSTNANRLKWTACIALFALITSIIGAGLQGSYYFFVTDIEVCVDSSRNCYGDCGTSYQSFATNCALSSASTNCNCVTSSCTQGNCNCYTYKKMDRCSDFVNEMPNYTFISFVLCLLCTVLSLVLMGISSYSLYLLSAATTEVFTTAGDARDGKYYEEVVPTGVDNII